MIIKYRNIWKLMAVTLLVMLFEGCTAVGEPKRLDAAFGQSVTSMIRAQTYDLQAADSTESRPVLELDGDKAQGSLDAYRKDIAKPQEIKNVINIGVGD